MRLFSRIFLSHFVAILVACVVVIITAELVSPGFYRQHLGHVTGSAGVENVDQQEVLVAGHQRILFLALLASLPFSIVLALGVAYIDTRRITNTIQALVEESHEIASGYYDRRLAITGKDELAELAFHFNQMAAALEEAEKSRTMLIGTVAHELRTPLAALQGYTEALTDGVISPEAAAHAIARELTGMRRITEDLLLVARVEAGALEFKRSALLPSALADEAYDRFVHAFEEKMVVLKTDVPDDLPPVYADRERSGQILGNLLTNALHYVPREGRVAIRAQKHDGSVQFSVSDNGPGIPLEHQGRVFERFYRVDSARSRGGRGTGIGLTIAKGLTEAMGGKIWLVSKPGQGATFFFTLPTIEADS